MWCIGTLTRGVPASHVRPARVVCRALAHRRAGGLHRREEPAIALAQPGAAADGLAHPTKVDYEYVRKGTTNLFVAIEPKAGKRTVAVTEHRGKTDFVAFIDELLTRTYAKARRVHLVLDNLNIHFRKSFEDVLGKRAAAKLLRRVEFHHTPKHASWLNMAEIEIGILTRQCLDRRIPNPRALQHEVDAWQFARNTLRRTIEWKFTRQDADRKLGRHYVPILAC